MQETKKKAIEAMLGARAVLSTAADTLETYAESVKPDTHPGWYAILGLASTCARSHSKIIKFLMDADKSG